MAVASPHLRRAVGVHVRRRLVFYLLSAALFALGASTGFIATRALSPDTNDLLTQYLSDFLSAGPAQVATPQAVMAATLRDGVVKSTGLIWLLGLSVIGAPLVCALLFLRGFAMGFSLGIVSASLSGHPAIVAWAVAIPQLLFGAPAVILAATGALMYALGAARRLLGAQEPRHVLGLFGSASFLALISAALYLLAGLLQAYLLPIASRVMA